eukprot:scaffold80_cov325-Pavlova_lutheri.AAC.2
MGKRADNSQFQAEQGKSFRVTHEVVIQLLHRHDRTSPPHLVHGANCTLPKLSTVHRLVLDFFQVNLPLASVGRRECAMFLEREELPILVEFPTLGQQRLGQGSPRIGPVGSDLLRCRAAIARRVAALRLQIDGAASFRRSPCTWQVLACRHPPLLSVVPGLQRCPSVSFRTHASPHAPLLRHLPCQIEPLGVLDDVCGPAQVAVQHGGLRALGVRQCAAWIFPATVPIEISSRKISIHRGRSRDSIRHHLLTPPSNGRVDGAGEEIAPVT